MQYLLLIYGAEDALDDAEREQCYQDSAALTRRLHDEGLLLGTNALHPVATATSVKTSNGRQLVTDGPFAETHEQLGGYLLVDVENLDKAIEIAREFPGGKEGTVEIRPVLTVEGLPE